MLYVASFPGLLWFQFWHTAGNQKMEPGNPGNEAMLYVPYSYSQYNVGLFFLVGSQLVVFMFLHCYMP